MKSLKAIKLAALVLGVIGMSAPAYAAGAPGEPLIEHEWSFNGIFGTYDRAQLQRGFKVYREVCAACHSMNLVSFRNLAEPGGPGFTDAQVRVIAAEYQVTDGPDDFGDMFQRPGVPADRFPSPYANEEQARAANGGAYPVDFSVLAKAREGGPDYIASLMKGYVDPPADFEVPPGQYYNRFFSGNLIAMAPQLPDGIVEYEDGTAMTTAQYSEDVAAFLMWTAEPKMEERKKMGLRVMLFLIFFATLLYFSYRKVWAALKK